MEIFFCGDVMTGRGVDQILGHPSSPRLYESHVQDAREYVALAEQVNGQIPRSVPPEYIWGDVLEIWEERNPDLKIANLETVITASDAFVPKGINYRMHPDNIPALVAAGIDIFSLANNHILDWGEQGLKDTISALDQIKVKHAGVGESLGNAQAPAAFEHQDGRVLLFSMCMKSSGVPRNWSAAESSPGVFLLDDALDENIVGQVRAVIDRCRKPNDTVITSIHWGDNWGYSIPASHVRFAHALIDEAGVDIVHGHSSHHPRSIEIYKGRPIFYGCGDFITDYEGVGGYEEFRDDLVLMYFVGFETRPFKVQKLELVCLQIHRFRLRRASPQDIRWMQGRLNETSKTFSTRFELTKQNVIFIAT